MDILKSFFINNQEYNVNILWEDDKPLFKANEIAKILDIKNIRPTIINYDNDERSVRQIYTTEGTREATFLTEIGLYKLLMRSDKPNAKPFQKWVYNILISIREKGKYELKIALDNKEKDIQLAIEKEANKYKKDVEKVTHAALISAFKDKYVVYFGKINIKPIDDIPSDKFLIKIGSTKQIQIRSLSLNKQFTIETNGNTSLQELNILDNYNNFNIFKVFEVPINEMFEKFLQKHPDIIKYKYDKPIYDGYSSNGEIFLVNDDELHIINTVAIRNKHKFCTIVDTEKIIELENVKLKQLENIKEIKEIDEKKITIDDNTIKEILNNSSYVKIDDIIKVDNRKHTQVRGNKIQRYSSDCKTLLETYDSYAYAMRDSKFENISRTTIKNAIKNNTIYKEYRWAELPREMPDDTFQELEKTVESKQVKTGFIAMLDLHKTQIVKVYSDQREAMKDRKFTSTASVSNAIKRNSVSSGHYFTLWCDCDETLKENYLKNNTLPEKKSSKSAINIEQLHPITEHFIKKYITIDDIVKEYKVSRGSIKTACEFNTSLKGYKWRYVNNNDNN